MDDLGNRAGQVTQRDGTHTYSVDSLTNRYTQIDAVTIEHDAAGNLERDRQGYWYQYDYENRIIRIYKLQGQTEVTVATFEYDALGRRIRKVDAVAAVTTLYYYDPDWRCLEERDGSDTLQRSFLYGNYIDEVLVMTVPGSPPTDYYYLHDHLYSPVALLSSGGSVVERYEYDAYGHVHSWLDAGPDQVWFTADDTMVDGGVSNGGNAYFFTGRRLDLLDSGALEVMYYRHRSYGPFVGRFFQRDPVAYEDLLNAYQYVYDNPLAFTDALGQIPNPIRGYVKRIEAYLASGEEELAAGEAKKLYEMLAIEGRWVEALPAALMRNWLDGAPKDPFTVSSRHVKGAMVDKSKRKPRRGEKKPNVPVLSPREQLTAVLCNWAKGSGMSSGAFAKKPFQLTATAGQYYHAFGTFTITFTGQYCCKKRKCEFEGVWEFYDKYDWHEILDAEVAGVTLKDSYAILVEKYWGAKKFEEQGTYQGSVVIKCK